MQGSSDIHIENIFWHLEESDKWNTTSKIFKHIIPLWWSFESVFLPTQQKKSYFIWVVTQKYALSFSDFQYFSGENVHSNAVSNDIYDNSTLLRMNQNDLYILFEDIEW